MADLLFDCFGLDQIRKTVLMHHEKMEINPKKNRENSE